MTVEDVFLMKNRGLVVLGWEKDDAVFFKIGDFIKITNPDGTALNSQINNLENLLFTKYSREYSVEKHGRYVGFVLKNLSKKMLLADQLLNLSLNFHHRR